MKTTDEIITEERRLSQDGLVYTMFNKKKWYSEREYNILLVKYNELLEDYNRLTGVKQ